MRLGFGRVHPAPVGDDATTEPRVARRAPSRMPHGRVASLAVVEAADRARDIVARAETSAAEILRKAESESANPVRRRAAKNALFHLGVEKNGKDADIVHVDQVLAKAAQTDDQFLRQVVALAFSFWDGPLAEETLQRLARDDGFGNRKTTAGLCGNGCCQ